MARFAYELRTSFGGLTRGTISAESKAAAQLLLKNKGLYLASLEEMGVALKLKFLKRWFTPRNVGTKDMVHFSSNLATMIRAGVSLINALSALHSQISNPVLKNVIGEVKSAIAGGVTFSGALERHEKVFSKLFVNLVRAGETAGMLDEMLRRLALLIRQDAESRAKIKSALVYPVVIGIVALMVVTFLVLFVLPRFAVLFEGMGETLPLPTRFLLWTSHFLIASWFLILPSIIGSVFIVRKLINTPQGKYIWDSWVLNVPVFGELIRKITVARFARTFGSLLKGGVPVLTSIYVLQKSITNSAFVRVTEELYRKAQRGEGISSALEESKLFPTSLIEVVKTGEQTGALCEIFIEVADFYESEVEISIKDLTSILEPAMIVLMGGVVGFIALSLILPMFNLIQKVH